MVGGAINCARRVRETRQICEVRSVLGGGDEYKAKIHARRSKQQAGMKAGD